MEFCEIYFLTKFVPEATKISLNTSSAPFWNGISVSNLLILSKFVVFWFYWLRYAKHLCSFFLIGLYFNSAYVMRQALLKIWTEALWSVFRILSHWQFLRLYCWYLSFKHTIGLLRHQRFQKKWKRPTKVVKAT